MRNCVVVTPVYYRRYLDATVKSVISNSCDLILVNDSSVPLEVKQPGVSVLDNGRNLGVGVSRDRGVALATSRGYDFIGFVDADSILSATWKREIDTVLQNDAVLGVSGLALNPNQRSRIARIKFLFKQYGRRTGVPFQIDCSMFKREAFQTANFGGLRIGEDSYFMHHIDMSRTRVCESAISYHHEVDSARAFFRKEIVGAFFSLSKPLSVVKGFLMTPYTCAKMAALRKKSPDYPAAALVWAIRQIVWSIAFVAGWIGGYRSTVSHASR
jgi:glycosyltransferase involved in cell wall biosynthesis